MANGVIQQDSQELAPRRPAAPGMTIPRLTFAEQLVLWSARRLAATGHGAAATENEASACRLDVRARVGGELSVALCPTGGPAAGVEAAEALERTLEIFGCAGVRSLQLNPMCCRFVSNDERLFLSFLAELPGGRLPAHRRAPFLVPPTRSGCEPRPTNGAAFARALLERRLPASSAAHAQREARACPNRAWTDESGGAAHAALGRMYAFSAPSEDRESERRVQAPCRKIRESTP